MAYEHGEEFYRPGRLQSNMSPASWAGYQKGRAEGRGGGGYQYPGAGQDVWGLRQQLMGQLGIPGLQQQMGAFQFSDLADIFRQESERRGLGKMAEEIGGLTTKRQEFQRTLEDLPETIGGAVTGAGETLTTAQLGRRAAAEGAPISRSISDLLSSISVLQEQRGAGLEEARYAAEAKGQAEQMQYGQLQQQLGGAMGQFESLFPSLMAQIEPAPGSLARRREEAEIAEIERPPYRGAGVTAPGGVDWGAIFGEQPAAGVPTAETPATRAPGGWFGNLFGFLPGRFGEVARGKRKGLFR